VCEKDWTVSDQDYWQAALQAGNVLGSIGTVAKPISSLFH